MVLKNPSSPGISFVFVVRFTVGLGRVDQTIPNAVAGELPELGFTPPITSTSVSKTVF